MFGQPAEHAVATPVLSGGRIIAVIYGEQPHISGADAAKTTTMIAEALACHAGTCNTAVSAPAARKETAQPAQAGQTGKTASARESAPATPNKKPIQFPGPARDAQRVVIRAGTQVTLDGIPGDLIDLSIGGAQVLLTQSVRPNQVVRLNLPTDAGQISCKGRVVWAVFEQSRTSMAMYRAGMKFSESDAAAVEAFMNDYSEIPIMQHQRSTSGVA
ncbi:MAG: PilZ domain-containing protein [Acidobacteria bacterium]|nr:PilZ domain-containing protein [Acidobacteriota bacterium]